MTWIQRTRTVLLVAGLVLAGVSALAQDAGGNTYAGRLSPRPIDGRLRGQLTGVGEITAVLEGNELKIVGTFNGMQTPAVAASVRRGLNAAVAGPPIAELEVSRGTSGLVYGSAMLNSSHLESLDKGAVYVQIDGEGAADGTLWGFLFKE